MKINLDIAKQPKALSICFLTEMWERFGYILIQTLLVFVLLQEYGMSTSEAGKLVGTFTGVLFITSVIAGYIADFFLGYLRSVLLGSILLFISYLSISMTTNYTYLCLGLSVLCIGTGLLKTNVSGFLGTFYEEEDKRRDAGFTIFYIGINIGPILGAIVSTSIQNYFHIVNYQNVFFVATIAALISGIIFYGGYKIYKYPLAKTNVSITDSLYALIIIMLSIGMVMWILYVPTVATIFFIGISITCIVTLIRVSLNTREQIRNTIIYILFLMIAVLYFSLYNQIFISINIFNDIAVNKNVLGFQFSPQAFVSIDNIGVIIFGIIVLKYWQKTSSATKFILSSIFLCAVFAILLIGVIWTSEYSLVSPWWVILAYFVLAFSEICISPIGLALATKLSPPNRKGLFIGSWLVAYGIAGELAGVISSNMDLPTVNSSLSIIKSSYMGIFEKFLFISVLIMIITLILTYSINKISKKPI